LGVPVDEVPAAMPLNGDPRVNAPAPSADVFRKSRLVFIGFMDCYFYGK